VVGKVVSLGHALAWGAGAEAQASGDEADIAGRRTT